MTPFQKATKKTLELMAPPTKLTVSEWADKYRMLSPESSAEPGPWDTSRAPYQKGMMDAFSDEEVDEIVFMTSSQVGKNEIMNNMLGYSIHLDPAPTLFMSPTETMAKSNSKDRITPMIRDTEELSELVIDVQGKDVSNAILHKSFPKGHLTFIGANSPSNLAMRPIKNLFEDEADRYPASAGKEGDPIKLAEKRTANFWNKKKIKASTPGNEDTSRIEPDYLRSNQQHYHVPCPSCKKKQQLKWSQVDWEKIEGETGMERHNPANAWINCQYCGYHMTDNDLMGMLEGGEWVAVYPERKIQGFHLNELYSPWVSLEQTIIPHLEASYSRDRELRKVWVNTSLGETFKENGESIKKDGLEGRAEDYGEDVDIPEGSVILTAAIDVQDDRLEMEVVGWNRHKENWGIEYNVIQGDPAHDQVWNEAFEWVRTPRFMASGLERIVSACAVDSGGHHTQEVYKFCKRHERHRFFAIKGKGGQGEPFIRTPTINNNVKCKLYTLGVDQEKSNLLLSNLKLETPGPNYSHFPKGRGYTEEWYKMLTSEERKIKFIKGEKYYYWALKKGHRRNEALDIRVYNKAALEIANVRWKLAETKLEALQKAMEIKETPIVLPQTIARPRRIRKSFTKNY